MNEYEINVLYLKYGRRLAPEGEPSPLDPLPTKPKHKPKRKPKPKLKSKPKLKKLKVKPTDTSPPPFAWPPPPSPKKKRSKKSQYRYMVRDNCSMPTKEGFERDHIVPLSLGFDLGVSVEDMNHPDNLQCLSLFS